MLERFPTIEVSKAVQTGESKLNLKNILIFLVNYLIKSYMV